MKLTKNSKIRILENYYSIDYALFGKQCKDLELCCPSLLENYRVTKASLMSLIIEMYKLIGHSPRNNDKFVNSDILHENAIAAAITARKESKKIISSQENIKKDIVNNINKTLHENVNSKLDINELTTKKIMEKSFSLAIDNLLIVKPLYESKLPNKLNSKEGKFIEEAYTVIKEQLVEQSVELSEIDSLYYDLKRNQK